LWFCLGTIPLIVVALGLCVVLPNYREQVAIRDAKRLGWSLETRDKVPEWIASWLERVSLPNLEEATRAKAFMRLRPGGLHPSFSGKGCFAPFSMMPGLTEINFSGHRCVDSDLIPLSNLQNLESLKLGEGVTDEGIAHLEHLTRLRTLDLSQSQVSDAGLVHLRHMSRLEELRLPRIDLSDSGLASLSQLTELRDCEISGSEVTDAGLAHIAGLKRLRRLRLFEAPISDDGLKHLSGLSGLEYLNLGWTKVGDRGLVHLSQLQNLYMLILSHTLITDAGLVQLQACSSLLVLFVEHTQVTDAGIARLKAALPFVEIER